MFSHIDIKFPTLSVPLTRAYSLTSSHARYEHEMHTVRFIDWSVSYDSISGGTPVTLTINGIGNTRTINGYVHHIKPDLSSDKNYVDVHIIGASYVFKQQSQKVWINATADQVVADLAQQNNFSYVAIPAPRVYDQISQSGMTDWELMVKLAKQNGYSLKADNTSIIFQPLTQDFTDVRQEAPYYAMRGLETRATGIYAFTPLIGESIPYEDAQKATAAINGTDRANAVTHSHVNQAPSTKTRKKTSDPVFDAYHTKTVAPTYEIAKYEADAADERNRYAYRGEVTVQGNPTILPDSPIYLDGIGKDYSGYWIVLGVSHDIKGNKEYSTTLLVGSDSLGVSSQWTDNKNVSSPSQTIKRVITPGVRQKTVIPKTKLQTIGKSPKESFKSSVSKAVNGPKTANKAAPSHKWVGSGGNLKAPNVVEKKMPPVVLEKMNRAHVR
jgi:phage protein D